MLVGAIFSILAGLMIALQSIFNARLGETAGLWTSNAFVHGSGFLFTLAVLMFIQSQPSLSAFKDVNIIYLLGGVLGAGIIFSVMQGVSNLGMSYSLTIIIVTQLFASLVINYFGLFGEAVINISLSKIFGFILMIIGLIIFQLF